MAKPLIRCPACRSRLLQPLRFRPLEDGHEVVERRCPECEHEDVIVTDALAASVWRRREHDHRVGIAARLLVLEAEEWLAGVAGAPESV